MVGPPKTDAIRDVTVPSRMLLKRLSKTAFTKTVKKRVRQCGQARYACARPALVGATLAAQAGATIKELISRIGHTTPAMACATRSPPKSETPPLLTSFPSWLPGRAGWISSTSGRLSPITDERNRLWGNGFPCKSATASATDLLAAADELDRLKE